MMKLSGSEVQSLHQALLSAFPKQSSLAQMVRFQLDENLSAIADGAEQSERIFDLIGWAESKGKLIDLINGAVEANPNNAVLSAWYKKHANYLHTHPNSTILKAIGELDKIADQSAEQGEHDDAKKQSQQSIVKPILVTKEDGLTRKLNVFMCYSKDDRLIVNELYRRLQNDNIDAWLDEVSLLPGQDWQMEIRKAVKNADVVLTCLSENSVNKRGYVQKEIRYALDEADEQPEGTIYIIPVRLEPCIVPDRLSTWHWLDLFSESGYDLLLRSLAARAFDLSLR